VEATALASAIREQRCLPVSETEADAMACSLERSASDEEFLANTLAALQLLLGRLEDGAADGGDREP
jgi:hypothetical protein